MVVTQVFLAWHGGRDCGRELRGWLMDDLAEWEQVGGEGNGTEHGALRDAVVG